MAVHVKEIITEVPERFSLSSKGQDHQGYPPVVMSFLVDVNGCAAGTSPLISASPRYRAGDPKAAHALCPRLCISEDLDEDGRPPSLRNLGLSASPAGP